MRTEWLAAALALGTVALAMPLSGGELTDIAGAKRLKGGIILLVSADRATYDEAAATGCTVRGLETEPAKVHALRARYLTQGIYGKLSVTGFDGHTLPCIDSLVNLVLVADAGVPQAEAMRVLAPGGTALIRTGTGWQTHVKPWPPEMDEWNQYLHGADNNGVADDSAGPPERLQWTAGSRYGRVKVVMPSVTSMVTAGGRIFTAEDIATTESGQVRKQYVLLARDAFNGCELWRHRLSDWDKERLGPVKIIPVQLQRLLVAVGDRVYCTNGFDGPVTVFNGADGRTVATFTGSENTREIAYADGVVYGIRGMPYAFGVNWRRTRMAEMKIDDVTLYARDAQSGSSLWKAVIKGSNGGPDGYIGGTLSIKGKRLAYITRTELVCRNSKTGREIWRRDYPFWADMPRKGASFLTYHTSPPTIVMADDRLFVAELDRIKAYAGADGALLWEGRNECNYTKNGDLFYTGGLVWTGLLEGLDPATGEVKRQLRQSRIGPMCHPRCYRNRITHTYYLNSKTGGTDLLSLDGGGEFPGPWMRATCGLAMTPSYGRLYSSPYVCSCEIGSMLLGFNCTYTQSRGRGKVMTVKPEPRLVKGAADGTLATRHLPLATASDWPTYRHDSARSGVTPAPIPEQVKVVWQTSLPGRPTPPVVADGLLLTAVRNIHTVYAVDSRTGERRWQFTADGPVDSPPTVYRGLALFGSRDGWVYCLEAATGRLVWKFSDMPAVRLVCDRAQLESAWPVNGSVMVMDGLVYFAAGRSSFLDGGIVVYALDPATGAVKYRRTMAGPYGEDGFPVVQRGSQFRSEGFRSGIFSSAGDNVFIRHQGFKRDLTPISPHDVRTPHLMASTGFLCDSPQHRTYWTIDTDLSYGPAKGYDTDGPQGDVIAVDGDTFYEVRGLSPGRHTWNDNPLKMYRVISGRKLPPGKRGRKVDRRAMGGGTVPRSKGWETWERRWTAQVPIAGHAILVGGQTVAVAGVPMLPGFTTDDVEESYAGGKGGLLWTISAENGQPRGELSLPSAPVWDGLAAAGGRLYLPLRNGAILCLGKADAKTAPPKTEVRLATPGATRVEEPPPPLERVQGPAVLLYSNDFEDSKVGSSPESVVGAEEAKGARIVVTDAVAAAGRHALELHDAADLPHAWNPMWETTLPADRMLAGTVALSFDVMMSRDQPGRLDVMLRHYGNYAEPPPWRTVASVSVLPEGAIAFGGKKISARNGVWHHVVIVFPQGGKGRRAVTCTIIAADGRKTTVDTAFRDRDFHALSWLGFAAGANAEATMYLDNITLKVRESP